MTSKLQALSRASATDRDSYRPEFFRSNTAAEMARLDELLKRVPQVQVFDQLHGQLTELVRSLNPSVRYTREELDVAAQSHLQGTPAEEYGVWVFYPWSNRLVHLLDESEFALVRTDRNRNKITREEQALLATKKVGVIGLSVGQSVSLTMALERSFGEIRLADFDTLELSNLNRIRSGVHNLGVSKVVNVAREIAEIDPFLKVTCFHEGITRENIDRFLTEGGNLDVLVEECDSVDVKIYARQRAKALRIPVIMDTSDRGLIDVERFDLEPERPILHGRLDDLNEFNPSMPIPDDQRIRISSAIVGFEELSPRMRSSIGLIGKELCTWPQLASSVALGGASACDIVRRMLLNEFRVSGRWYLDPAELLTADKALGSSLETTKPL